MELSSVYASQYEMVKGTREALLSYCKGLDPADLTKEHPHVGHGGSIRTLSYYLSRRNESAYPDGH